MTVQTAENSLTVPNPYAATQAGGMLATRPPSRISEWVSSLGHAAKAAETIVDTPLCPDAWWPLPGGVKLWNIPDRNPRLMLPNEDADSFNRRRQVAISTGAVVLSAAESLGLDTLAAAVTGVYVVGAKPALYAETMLGLLHAAGWRSRMVERTGTRGAVALWRSGEPQDAARVYEFTIEQAERAGYVPKKGPNVGKDRGGNEQYVLRPETMLYWRAVSTGCRLEAPELMKGMKSAEELSDEVAIERVTVTAEVARPVAAADVKPAAIGGAPGRSASEALRGAPADAAPLVGLQAHGAVRDAAASTRLDGETQSMPNATADGITDAQLRKLGAVMGDLGVTGTGSRERRLAIAARIAGRDLGSSKDLTKDEAHLIIDTLDGIARGDDAAVRLDRLERGLPIEPTADHQGSPSAPAATPQASAAEQAQAAAADVDAQIAAARADADARSAQWDAEQAQADEVDPTLGAEWPA